MNYSKGNWESQMSITGERVIVVENDDTGIEFICSGVRYWNKDLICAAPLLYEALKAIVERVEQGLALGEALEIEPARKALMKAEGK